MSVRLETCFPFYWTEIQEPGYAYHSIYKTGRQEAEADIEEAISRKSLYIKYMNKNPGPIKGFGFHNTVIRFISSIY